MSFSKKLNQALNESDERQANFEKWFADSKVVDSKGNPLKVYHGTNQPIQNFDKKRLGSSTASASSREGFYFSDDPEVAHVYAKKAGTVVPSSVSNFEKLLVKAEKKCTELEKRAQFTRKEQDWDAYEKAMIEYEDLALSPQKEDDTTGMNIIPVYLSIKNPIEVDMKGQAFLKKPDSEDIIYLDDLIKQAKKTGRDGVIIRNSVDAGSYQVPSTHFVVFKSSQVKSAIGNKGAFSSKSSKITEDLVEEGRMAKLAGAAAIAASMGIGGYLGHNSVNTSDAPTPKASQTTIASEALPVPSKKQGPPEWSSSFISFIKSLENSKKDGFKNGKWYPCESFEGGYQTIGYGYKIRTDAEKKLLAKGISDIDAVSLLEDELDESWSKANQYVKSNFNMDLASLPINSQEMLTEFVFNIGNLGLFPKFTESIVNNDIKKASQEYKRSAKKPNGERVELTRRNEMFFNRYLTRDIAMKNESSESASTKVINADGSLKTVYHGPTKGRNFKSFKTPAFFTDSKEYAARYIDDDQEPIQAHLDIKNPLYMDASKHELGSDCEELANDPKWVKEQIKLGYDGVVIKDGEVTDYVAFYPGQITRLDDSVHESAEAFVTYRGTSAGRGTGIYKLGKGLYSTTSVKAAQSYGTVTKLLDAVPSNPLRLKSYEDFDGWVMDQVEKLKLQSVREFNKKYPDIGVYIRELGFNGVAIGSGKDQDFVKYLSEDGNKVKEESMKPIAFVINGKIVPEQKLFKESISAEYSVPEDRETRIYDFYTLALYDSLLRHKATVKTGLLKPGWDEDTVADLKAYVHDGMDVISKELKADLLDATALSISSELRHAFDNPDNHMRVIEIFDDTKEEQPEKDSSDDEDGLDRKDTPKEESLKDKIKRFYAKLIQQKALSQAPDWVKKSRNWKRSGNNEDYTIAKRAFDRSGMSYQDLAKIGEKVFMLPIWPDSYGGRPWKNICLGLARLDKAEKIDDVISATDHILDLEHNTGAMLNKVKRFRKNDSGFQWIKKALDFKFKARPWDLAQKSSISTAIIGRLNRLTGADVDFEKYQKNVKEESVFKNPDALSKDIWKKIKPLFVSPKGIEDSENLLIDEWGNVLKVNGNDVIDFVQDSFYPGKDFDQMKVSFDNAFNKMMFNYNVVNLVQKIKDGNLFINVKASDPLSRLTKGQIENIRHLTSQKYKKETHDKILVSYSSFDNSFNKFKTTDASVDSVEEVVKFFKKRSVQKNNISVPDPAFEKSLKYGKNSKEGIESKPLAFQISSINFPKALKKLWMQNESNHQFFSLDAIGTALDVSKEYGAFNMLKAVVEGGTDLRFVPPKTTNEVDDCWKFLFEQKKMAFIGIEKLESKANITISNDGSYLAHNQIIAIQDFIKDVLSESNTLRVEMYEIKCKHGEMKNELKEKMTFENDGLSFKNARDFIKDKSKFKDLEDVSKEDAIGDYFWNTFDKYFGVPEKIGMSNNPLGFLVNKAGKCLVSSNAFVSQTKDNLSSFYGAWNTTHLFPSGTDYVKFGENLIKHFNEKGLIVVSQDGSGIVIRVNSSNTFTQRQIGFIAHFAGPSFIKGKVEVSFVKIGSNESPFKKKVYYNASELIKDLRDEKEEKSSSDMPGFDDLKSMNDFMNNIDSGFRHLNPEDTEELPVSLLVNSIGLVQSFAHHYEDDFIENIHKKYSPKKTQLGFSQFTLAQKKWALIEFTPNRVNLVVGNRSATKSQIHVFQSLVNVLSAKLFSKNKVVYFNGKSILEKYQSKSITGDCKSVQDIENMVAKVTGQTGGSSATSVKEEKPLDSNPTEAHSEKSVYALIKKNGAVTITGSGVKPLSGILEKWSGVAYMFSQAELDSIPHWNSKYPILTFEWSKKNFPVPLIGAEFAAEEIIKSLLEKHATVGVMQKGALYAIRSDEDISKYKSIIVHQEDAI